MSISTHNPEDNEAAGISEALRRDARRIGEAPFDMALQRETMARVRALKDAGRARFRFGFAPALAAASVAVVAAALFISFPFKPVTHREAALVAEVVPLREVAPRASVWFYERALAEGDAAFSAALDRDAQTLLPATAKLPEGLL